MARKPALTPASSDGAAGTTRASAVYDRLRADITHGLLEPGSKLRMSAMGERYGVGASPLREALSRLSAEGLVARSDQRGFSVASLNWDELPLLARTRLKLECLALVESIEHRSAAWEDHLAVVLHRLSRTPRSLAQDHFVLNPEWETLHREFHRALLANCPSRWLRAFCEEMADEAYRFRQLAAVKNFGTRDTHSEHVAIFEAAIQGRSELATRLLSEHFGQTTQVVSQHAREAVRPAPAPARRALAAR